MSIILHVKNLSKTIKGKKLVDQISFDVHTGEVFGFLGPNGAGKTTTIRMLVGLIKPTSGTILIAGKNIKSEFQEAMRHIGCIVENPELYEFLTGWENLQQFARMIGHVSDQRLLEIVEQVRLSARIHDRVKTYSLGMKQRLGIAQALLAKPKLLILDEPTNGLDPAGIRELRKFVRNLVENEGMAVFISSHLLSEIQLMCDRVAIINQGRMITVATVNDLIEQHSSNYIDWYVAPIAKAETIMRKFEMINNLFVTENSIRCQIEDQYISLIVKELVHHNLAISGVNHISITLEDLFMQLTNQKD